MIKTYYKKLISEKIRNRIHDLIRKIKGLFLRGNQFYCNYCSHSFRKFLPKGNGIELRNNAICPHCGSLERTRLLYFYLCNETKIFNSQPFVLHIAPEQTLKNKFKTNPNYYDVDINPQLATYQMDITKTSFGDNTFDFIICSHVLGHIKNEKVAINELYRILKKGGKLLTLTLINTQSAHTFEDQNIKTELEKTKSYGEKDLERLHGKDFIKRLASPQVDVQQIDYRLHFSADDNLKYSLGNGNREIIYVSTKI